MTPRNTGRVADMTPDQVRVRAAAAGKFLGRRGSRRCSQANMTGDAPCEAGHIVRTAAATARASSATTVTGARGSYTSVRRWS